jgi:hypothetical protein
MRLLIGCLICLLAGCAAPVPGSTNNGKFVGHVVAQWLDDGRKMKLVEPFGYIDPSGLSWDAPIGSVVDGASIPQVAWSLIGGPFEGKYRNASVIHDVACEEKLRPWPDVHRNFYYGMLASGVDEKLAKVMYGAVYQYGPRWSLSVRRVVPLSDVDLALSRYRALVKPGEVVATYMTPIPKGTICDAAGNCTVSGFPTASDPLNAFVIADYRPAVATLTVSDFDKLKAFIETTNPPLAAIENYRPER